jgi:hypothetical protein
MTRHSLNTLGRADSWDLPWRRERAPAISTYLLMAVGLVSR